MIRNVQEEVAKIQSFQLLFVMCAVVVFEVDSVSRPNTLQSLITPRLFLDADLAVRAGVVPLRPRTTVVIITVTRIVLAVASMVSLPLRVPVPVTGCLVGLSVRLPIASITPIAIGIVRW